MRSRVSFPRFVEEYRECIDSDFVKYYAIGKIFSKVNVNQFKLFCDRIQAPIEKADLSIRKLFNPSLIEEVFLTKEYAFDAVRLKERVYCDLEKAKINLRLNSEVIKLKRKENNELIEVFYQDKKQDNYIEKITTKYLFNCTYSGINNILSASELPTIPLKHELTEMALVQVPDRIKNIGVIVMWWTIFFHHAFSLPQLTLLGIFILTIALNVGTGTFFVLPSLLVWGSYIFRTSKLFSGKFLGLGFAVILLGFILNSLLLKIIGHPETSSSYGNFAIIFYGVITETNWLQIYQDYPEINQLKGAEFSEKTNQILWQTIINNPTHSVKGIIKQWTKFFTNEYQSIFFIERNSSELTLRFLGVIGLIFSLLNVRKNPVSSLILFYFLGVFASIPFAPVQDGGLRVYAATVVIFPILSAVGLYCISKVYVINPLIVLYIDNIILNNNYLNYKLKPLFSCNNSSEHSENKLLINRDLVLSILSLALVIISFFAPIFIKQITSIPDNSELSCPVGLESAYFSYNSGSYINLVSDNAIENSHLPNLRISDFREGLKTFAPWLTEEPKAFATLNDNITIADIYRRQWLIIPSELLPEKKGKIFVCGKKESIGELNLFYAKELKSISSKID